MEPFELKLHQVTFEESDSTLLEHADSQEEPELDSFSTLVHYDADFEHRRTGAEDTTYRNQLQSFALPALGKVKQGHQQGGWPSSSSTSSNLLYSTTCTTTTTTGPHSACATSTPLPLRRGVAWEGGFDTGEGVSLVNPDDSYLSVSTPTQPGKISPEVAAAALRTLSQVSINTSAIARHLRQLKKGGKRRIAKTTVTSTTLASPVTMPIEKPASSGPVSSPSSSATALVDGEEGDSVGDSSFETVAEALRLQWSVIGNSNVTPASPEEVARIVAEAEKRLRGEASPSRLGEAGLPLTDPVTSDLRSVGSESSLSSLSSAAANDNGIMGVVDVHTGRVVVDSIESESLAAELVQIPAASITREVEKSSWFQSRDKGRPLMADSERVEASRTGPDMSVGSGASQSSSSGVHIPSSLSAAHARRISGSERARQNGGGERESGMSPAVGGKSGVVSSVPLRSGVSSSPAELGTEPVKGSPMPHWSPTTHSTKTIGHSRVHQGSPFQQENPTPLHHSAALPDSAFLQQLQPSPTSSAVQQQASLVASSNAEYSTNSNTAPLPALFNPNLIARPQIGPLFPRKAGPGVVGVPSGWKSGVGGGGVVMEGGGVTVEVFEELMREKLKLEGQLEVLQDEAHSTLQERATLQAQLASLQLKLKSGQQRVDDTEKAALKVELERLRATRVEHEREAVEVQHILEEKLEELKAVTEDLYQSQDSVDKLQVRMKELRDDLQAREVTIQALKSKIAELYVEVQTTLQSKMEADSEARTAKNDLASLVKAKEWYQEQLSTAHQVRARLQAQLTQLQAQTVSQGSIVERLKLESGRLRQQLRDSQERALREKEQLARHLEAIQQDMMDREAAFQEIQRERLLIEDTFNTQVTTVAEEQSRISTLLQLTSDLESQLELAHVNSRKKQEQIMAVESQHMDLVKKQALLQESLMEKEQLLEEANQRLIEVESQLEALTQTVTAKDRELLKLREDKASTEIALKAALLEKDSVDKALTVLKQDMGKVEKSFKQMRQELGTRVAELETAQARQKATRDELDRVAHELDIKTRSVDTLTRSHSEQLALTERLRAEKSNAEQQAVFLRQQLQQAQSASPADSSLTQSLQTELQEARAHLAEAEDRLRMSRVQLQQQETVAASVERQLPLEDGHSDEQLKAMVVEKESLTQQLQDVQEAMQRLQEAAEKQRQEMGGEVSSLRSELTEQRTEFECKVESYVAQLHQVTEEKRRLEMELEMTRRKQELSSVQQQESINAELQKLVKELEAAQLHRQAVEEQLYGLRTQKEAEVTALSAELHRLQQSTQDLEQQQQQEQQVRQDRDAALVQRLTLELEKERGRIAGLQQSNSTLKEHLKQVEEALAGRESALVEVNGHLEVSHWEREKEQQQYLRRIQELEGFLKKERDGGRDLRKQIGSKLTENKRLLKQQEVHKREQVELQEVVDRRTTEVTCLMADLEAARQAVRDQQTEVQTLQGEKMAVEGELERVRREVMDMKDRNPLLLEQIQSLEWQVMQRTQEVEAAREQLLLAEQRQAAEIDSLRNALQAKQEEVDGLQAEVASTRQEKADQKSRVSELRSVLKASVQHHKLTKKLNSRRKDRGAGDADSREEKATQADMGNGVIIPPLPFDMEAVEKLLLDTAVKPLDSKPLDNLSSCLSSLRAEITGLQRQMEVHTTTIHSSTLSFRDVESEVRGLQEVVRSMANTIMGSAHTTTTATTTTAADIATEIVDDGDVVHL